MSDSFISDILYYKERQMSENIAKFFMLSFSCDFFYLDSTFISDEFTFLRVQMQDSLVYYKLSWIFSLLIFREIWHWTISMIYSPKNHQRKKTPFSPRIYLYQDFLIFTVQVLRPKDITKISYGRKLMTDSSRLKILKFYKIRIPKGIWRALKHGFKDR